MLGNSDSSSGGGSLVSNLAQRSFNVQNENDVISLLRYIHVNPIEAGMKNLLRDRIFAYRQSGDSALLPEIVQIFAALGVTVEAVDESVSARETAPAATEEPVVKKPAVMGRPKPKFSVVVPTAVSAQTTAPASIPLTHSQTASAPAQQVPVPPPLAAAPTTPASPAPVPPPPVEYRDPMDRIQEIKRIVNQKVGNPVKLIETHPEIGREYMQSLLDAMKKATGGGAQGDLDAAMAVLEAAFTKVDMLDLSAHASTPAQNEAPASVSEPEPSPEPIKTAIPAEPIFEPIIAPESSAIVPPEPAIPVAEKEKTIPIKSAPHAVERTVPAFESTLVKKEVKPILQHLQPQTDPVPQEKTVLSASPFTSVKQQLENANDLQKAEPAPIQEQEIRRMPLTASAPEQQAPASQLEMHSVGKEKQLQDLLRAKRQKEATTQQQKEQARISAMDPLQTPEVTSGLSQLLSEWSLFKNSGLFGMGPSGKDHVLYKRIAPLTMAAVIAGRFEGATPEIKQNITDYMNGWRYEEGIVHEHGETFEHYLRRVIRHILNKKTVAQ